MWQIVHKCSPETPIGEYAVMQKWTDDAPRRPLTQFICPKCHEEFFVTGHEAFFEAKSMQEQQDSRLPPGFVLPFMPKST